MAYNLSETALGATTAPGASHRAQDEPSGSVEVVFLQDWKCARAGDRRLVTADCAAVWEELGIAKRLSRPPLNRMVSAPAVAK
jgi:hypothetical protein